jgi:hypothetical protein
VNKNPHFPNSKNSENLPHCKEFIKVDCSQISRFYYILTFLGKLFSSSKLSDLKQQLIILQNEHGKGYTWHFY